MLKNFETTGMPRGVHQFKSAFAKHVGEDKLYGKGRMSHFKHHDEHIDQLYLEAVRKERKQFQPVSEHWWENS